jgi:hypothetical protein
MLVSVSRTTLTQIPGRLSRRGPVEQGYRTVRVVNAPGLAAFASDR